jgi:hypothetical protein
MSGPEDVRSLLDLAERAAAAGDLVSADELLRRVARLQEAELGPLHPDLADTLNNLAIVAEKTGRPEDAEAFYRRAVAIASSSLPPDDPRVAASRQNLEDFCRARGIPIDRPAAPTPRIAPAPRVSPREREIEKASTAAAVSVAPVAFAKIAIGVIVVALMIALLVKRPWSSSHDTPRDSPATSPAPHAAEPAAPPTATPPPIEKTQPPPPPAVRRRDVTLASGQLGGRFSTNGGNWRCDPVGASVPPGRIVLYTRVRSPRDATVVHRWYRGDTLRQSVRLPVQANATEGYRTYSRQTVDAGDWRVEVRNAAGDLLHEQHVTVK